MNEKIKLLLASVLAFFSFGCLVNLVYQKSGDIFLARSLSGQPPVFLSASISGYSDNLIASSNPPQNCKVMAESYLTAEVSKTGQVEIIFQKNIDQKMALASLTKILTAIVVDEFYPDNYPIVVSQKAVNREEDFGQLEAGETLNKEELMLIMLTESSNDAAFALAEQAGLNGFQFLMNKKAEQIGMANSYFYNPSGLDSVNSEKINYSTTRDLLKLAQYLLEKPNILELTLKNNYALYLSGGSFHHTLQNTNQLLEEFPDLIIGGKTGFTRQAGGCLLIISNGKKPQSKRINIVLNSPYRFSDMRRLLTCASFK